MRGDALLGRTVELARLDGLIGDIGERGAALVVVGEAGIGKSALMDAAAQRAAAAGVQVLRASGVPSETQLAFAGLDQLLRPQVHRIDALPAPQRDALRAAFGEIDVEADGIDPLAVALAALTLLRDVADEHPLLVVAEDIQWLDERTASILAFAARRLEQDPIVLLASARDMPIGPFADARLEQVALTGLSDEDATTLLQRHAPDLDDLLRTRLLEEARGNPLALVELGIAWRQLPAGTVLSSHVPLTTRLRDTYTGRIRSLPDACQVFLLVTALNDGGSPAETLAAGAMLTGEPRALADLSQAVEERLIEVEHGGLRFRHPLVRAAIIDSSEGADRRAAAAALGEVVEDRHRAAWHRAAAAVLPDGELADELDEVAETAYRRGAMVDAFAARERAAALSPDTRSKGRRLVSAAEVAAELGRADAVRRLLDEAEPLDLEPPDRARAELRRRLADGTAWDDVGQVRDLVTLAVETSAMGDTDRALAAMTNAAITGWWINFDQDRREVLIEGADALHVDPDDPRLVGIVGMADPVGRGRAVLAQLEALPPREVDDPALLSVLGSTASMLGRPDLAVPLIDASIRGLREQGRLDYLSSSLTTRSWLAWYGGQWDLAARRSAEAARLGEQTERPVNLAMAQLVGAALAAAHDDTDEARQILDEVESFLRPLGAVPILALAAYVRAVAALADGDRDRAFQLLAPLLPLGRVAEFAVVNQGAITLYFDAATQTGHQAEARAVLDELATGAERSGSHAMSTGVLYGSALLADDDRADDAFAAAFSPALARLPFAEARLQLAYGTWLRRQRRISHSRVPLRAARDTFDQLGAIPWGDRARQELRATGESSHQRKAAASEALTAQELEIARLAAKGLTNKQIGQQLYLSHRTVGSHLYRVFPKLGITSRAELASVLAAG
jgi:DNA-binding CsgD family transcriptional regulator